MRFPFILIPTIIVLLVSCQKDSDNSDPSNPPLSNTTSVSLQFNSNFSTFEVLITDLEEKVLADTMLETNKKHSVVVPFSLNEYNLTTIVYDSTNKKFFSTTFRKIKATDWVIQLPPNLMGTTIITGGADAKITYQNVPAFTGSSWYAGSQFVPNTSTVLSPTRNGTNIEVNYKRSDNKYIGYLMLPSISLCKTFRTTSANDIVDCTNMDSVIKFTYDKPSNLSHKDIIVQGFQNADNYTNGVRVFNTNKFLLGDQYDVMYPKKGFEKFYFYSTWLDNESNQFVYCHLGDTIPKKLPFMDKSFFQINTDQVSNFQVQFIKEQPSSFTISLSSLKLNSSIAAAPADANIDIAKFRSIMSGSKLLKAENISDLKVNKFASFKIDSYSYLDYFDHIYSPASTDRKDYVIKSYSISKF